MAPHLQALLLLQLVLLSSLASAPHRADAWGKQGHIMVCKIAEKYLSEKAAAAVQDLLPESAGGELSTVCPWADTVKFHYRWSSPLHYANTPNVCNFKFSTMCRGPAPEPLPLDICMSQIAPWSRATNHTLEFVSALIKLAIYDGDVRISILN